MSGIERVCRGLIAAASRMVPRSRRGAWREEWEAEVWYEVHGAAAGEVSPVRGVKLVLRCLGAFPHAAWVHADAWRVDGVWQDLRFGARTLARRPGFTIVAVLTLGLGIGGNTAVFSVVNAVLLRPLPIANADRLVYTWGRNFPGGPGASVSPPDYMDYRAGTVGVFEEFAAQSSWTAAIVVDANGNPEELRGRAFTANFLATLGHEPAVGRSFTQAETTVGGPAVVMISHGLWGRMFGFDPGAAGATLRLDGEAVTIVGVLPEDLTYPAALDIWFPLEFGGPGYQSRAAHFLRPIGLLRRGVTVEQAQSALDAVSARLEATHPDTNDGWYAVLQPLREVFTVSVRPALVVLLAAVGLVLLIACGNVANLLLARAAARRGEIAVRAAMGATRLRLARQVVTESLLLAAVGGAVGVALAWAGVEALRVLEPGNLPRIDEVGVDATTLAFCAALSLGVGLVFGMVPALGLRRDNLEDALGTVGRGQSGGRSRMVNVLVAGEVALSFVLLIGAGLLFRSFLELRSVDPGFDVEGAVAIPVSLPERTWRDLDALEAVRDEIAQRLAAVPGVAAVGAASILPLSGSQGDTYVYAEGRPPARIQDIDNTAQIRLVDETYFDAMGVPIAAGRSFAVHDDRSAPDRVILNETLANDLFPGEDAVGKRIVAWLDDETPLEIVGVASDVRQFSLGFPAQREFYLSARQRGARSLSFVVRGRDGALPPVAALRDAIRTADPGQPVSRVTPLETYIDGAVATDRFQAVLLVLFAGLALALAAIGIYGVLAHAVGQRRREIGIRMAMGAERGSVAGLVIRQGFAVALVGAALGLAGAAVAARALRSLLYGVGPVDPLTWVGTTMFILTVVLLSSWLPARQAARTDPATVLREDS